MNKNNRYTVEYNISCQTVKNDHNTKKRILLQMIPTSCWQRLHNNLEQIDTYAQYSKTGIASGMSFITELDLLEKVWIQTKYPLFRRASKKR